MMQGLPLCVGDKDKAIVDDVGKSGAYIIPTEVPESTAGTWAIEFLDLMAIENLPDDVYTGKNQCELRRISVMMLGWPGDEAHI